MWARTRAGLSAEALSRKLGVTPGRLEEWERSGRITMRQADGLAHYTHTPLGYLYLPDVQETRLPIPDFRTVDGIPPPRPSPDLLETVQIMRRRQSWMRESLIEDGASALRFVGGFKLTDRYEEVAHAMREILRMKRGWASVIPDWSTAVRTLRERMERAGVLVVINGVVDNNTSRKLDPNEFRGFALVDRYAPLVFVNGSDYRTAQVFTLVHELAHLFVGEDGVSVFVYLQPAEHAIEVFCDQVAAEFLVPGADLRSCWSECGGGSRSFESIARQFKVSTLVVARRALDVGLLERQHFLEFIRQRRHGLGKPDERNQGGGNFWNNQPNRVGRRFGAAVVRAVREHRLLYREAYSLTGLRGDTFDRFAEKFGDL